MGVGKMHGILGGCPGPPVEGAGRAPGERGQMTVELAVAFPVLLVVALVVVNAAMFFGQCAAFDNLFCDAVRVHAASPAYGQGTAQSVTLVQEAMDQAFSEGNVEVAVWADDAGLGHTRFTGTLRFAPTLFGYPFRSEAFGVAFPRLSHSAQIVVDCYKPGVLL